MCLLVCQQPRCFSHHLRRKRTEMSHDSRGVVLGVVHAALPELRSKERHDDQGRLLGILWWLNMPRVSNKNHREDQEHLISGKAESVRLSHCDLLLLPLILCVSIMVSYLSLRCNIDNKARHHVSFSATNTFLPRSQCKCIAGHNHRLPSQVSRFAKLQIVVLFT